MKSAIAREMQASVTEFAESTRTAQEAACAVGTAVAQIVKSLEFVRDEQPILTLVSGANRADLGKLSATARGTVRRPDADAVRAATGYAIGAAPPVGNDRPLTTFCDASLLAFEQVWAAAGTPNSVFPIAPGELERTCGARVVGLAE